MGSSCGFNTASRIYKPTVSLDGRIRTFTPQYSSPEVLRAIEGDAAIQKYVLGTVDVYSWAMCFYSMLLKRSADDLEEENELYKKGSEAEYTNFIKGVEIGLKNIKPNGSEEAKKVETVSKELMKALMFEPGKRPTMSELAADMKNCEQTKNIKIKYAEVEQQHSDRIMKMLGVQKGNSSDSLIKALEEANEKIKFLVSMQEETKKTNIKEVFKPANNDKVKIAINLDPEEKQYFTLRKVFKVVLLGRDTLFKSCIYDTLQSENKRSFSGKFTPELCVLNLIKSTKYETTIQLEMRDELQLPENLLPFINAAVIICDNSDDSIVEYAYFYKKKIDKSFPKNIETAILARNDSGTTLQLTKLEKLKKFAEENSYFLGLASGAGANGIKEFLVDFAEHLSIFY
eukprot:TRINITY_DN12877_c0_g1_i1.p1 TRINITY_DN12877_c0_g1~~TRINITY_DN12877_c0_g1_i1.p1  ORF type:complete len:401 (-),score=60.22 TRINITY_DN12877_c0_g1_i1:174-1376(-)